MKWLIVLMSVLPVVAAAELCPCPSSDAQYTNYPAANYDPGAVHFMPPVQPMAPAQMAYPPAMPMAANPYLYTAMPAGMPVTGLSPMTYAYPNMTAFPMAAGGYPGMFTQPWVNNPMMNAFNGMGGPFNSGIPGLNNGFPFSMPW